MSQNNTKCRNWILYCLLWKVVPFLNQTSAFIFCKFPHYIRLTAVIIFFTISVSSPSVTTNEFIAYFRVPGFKVIMTFRAPCPPWIYSPFKMKSNSNLLPSLHSSLYIIQFYPRNWQTPFHKFFLCATNVHHRLSNMVQNYTVPPQGSHPINMYLPFLTVA